jgi:hypothetical protein
VSWFGDTLKTEIGKLATFNTNVLASKYETTFRAKTFLTEAGTGQDSNGVAVSTETGYALLWRIPSIPEAAAGKSAEFIGVDRNRTPVFRRATGVNNGWTDSPLFYRGNLLGAVGQSAGVPTGAIIETGTNASGTYTKFADGTMICFRNYTDVSHTTSLNAGYNVKAMSSIVYPAVFATDPISSHCALLPDGGLSVLRWCGNTGLGVSRSSWNFVAISAAPLSNAKVAFSLAALGRWF